MPRRVCSRREIVTADGNIRVVNESREPDLFWALKGGGGGTFGVVTRLTLATHELPKTFGAVSATIRARSDEAYRRLLARFVELYATSLCNPHWGEQVRAQPDNRLEISMVFQGLTQSEARAAWKPLIDFANANAADYEGQNGLVVLALPARLFWNAGMHRLLASAAVNFDGRADASSSDFWWAGNTDEVGAFWHAYLSAWMPASLLKPENQGRLVDAWFAASRHWTVSFHFNKGLAGAPAAAIEAARNTAMNPEVLEAFALAIVASESPAAFDGLSADGIAAARARRARVEAAMAALRAAAPDAGAYVNECDYFQPAWQKAFWGSNYPRLLQIKHRYDPDGLFFVHHGVGSETWAAGRVHAKAAIAGMKNRVGSYFHRRFAFEWAGFRLAGPVGRGFLSSWPDWILWAVTMAAIRPGKRLSISAQREVLRISTPRRSPRIKPASRRALKCWESVDLGTDR